MGNDARGELERILLIGGSGRLGRHVTDGVIAAGWRSRLLTRDPGAARARFGAALEIAAGAIEDAGELDAALDGISRLFLLTPITEALADMQGRVVAAAERAGVRRIVKISGSDWTLAHRDRSRAGRLHALVEARLAESPAETVAIRPNAWMQLSLQGLLAAWAAGADGPPAAADAPVSYIDITDIADVTVLALTAPQVPAGTLVLTGPEALRWAAIRERLPPRETIGRTPVAPPHASNPFHAAAVGEFRALIAAGTTTGADLLGRPPRTVWPVIEGLLGTRLTV